MNKAVCSLVVLLSLTVIVHGQQAVSMGEGFVADSLMKWGLHLFALDDAKDHSESLVAEQFAVAQVEAVLAYADYDSTVHVLFISGDKQPRVIYEFGCALPYDPMAVHLMSADRQATEKELSLFKLRRRVVKMEKKRLANAPVDAMLNTFTVFQRGNWHTFLVTEVFEPQKIGLGNEQYLKYNEKIKVKYKHRPNQNFIHIQTTLPQGANPKEFASFNVHSDVSSAVASIGEVYLLFKHRNRLPWDMHVVLSDDFATEINTKTLQIGILPRTDWDKKME